MLTIGDFSRLSRITPRMLRHYDAPGLLRPEEVGDNGYRYYRQEQLSDLMRIQWLKGYGFSLGEIGALLALDDAQLLLRLRQRRLALYQELNRQQGLIHQIEADILRMEGTSMIETPYHVVLIEDPEQKVFSIRETIGVDQFHDFFERLYQEAGADPGRTDPDALPRRGVQPQTLRCGGPDGGGPGRSRCQNQARLYLRGGTAQGSLRKPASGL